MMEPKFLVDINVGRLVKWLRILGYDAVLSPSLDDRDLVQQALEEGRLLITRDTRLVRRRTVVQGLLSAVLIRSDELWQQLRQVIAEVGLHINGGFSRCPRCNTALESIVRERVQERVPPHVFHTQQEFQTCHTCNRIYWQGTHWRNIREELARVAREEP